MFFDVLQVFVLFGVHSTGKMVFGNLFLVISIHIWAYVSR